MAMLRMTLTALAVAPLIALAQTYPDRPIKLVVPYPPGGSTDLLARTIGQKMSDSLGQQIVVENRGGAGGMLGTGTVAKSAPDGYSIVLSSLKSLLETGKGLDVFAKPN